MMVPRFIRPRKGVVVDPLKIVSKMAFDTPISLAVIQNNRFLLMKNLKNPEDVIYFQVPKPMDAKITGNDLHLSSSEEVAHTNFVNRINRIKKHLEEGVKKRLTLNGLGFRVIDKIAEAGCVEFKLGFSHNKKLPIPSDMKFSSYKLKGVSNKINITVEGTDAVRLGNLVARMKRLKKKDVYKGKGFHDKGAKIVLKTFKKK